MEKLTKKDYEEIRYWLSVAEQQFGYDVHHLSTPEKLVHLDTITDTQQKFALNQKIAIGKMCQKLWKVEYGD